MKLISKFKASIRNKILGLVLGLSLGAILVVALISTDTIGDQGENAQKGSILLGKDAVAVSKEALKEQAKDYLSHIAGDQAFLSNILLKKVMEEVEIMAERASLIMESPLFSIISRIYSKRQKSSPLEASSSHWAYKTAPKKNNREEIQSSSMDSIFKPIFHEDEHLDYLAIAFPSGFYRYYPPRKVVDATYDPRKRPWYIKAVEEKDTIWIDPYPSESAGQMVITCARPFYSQEGKLLGVVKADIKIETLDEKILNTRVRGFGYGILIDKKGEIIDYIAQDSNQGEAIKSEAQMYARHPEIKDIAKKIMYEVAKDESSQEVMYKKATFEFQHGGKEEYIACAYIPAAKWSLGIVVPIENITAKFEILVKDKIKTGTKNLVQDIEEEGQELLMWLSLVFIAVTVLVTYLGLRFSHKITSPILELDKGAGTLGSGNLDHRLDIKTGDEIEDLSNTFNRMAADLKLYMKNLEETTAAKERIESDLRVATQIQASMLPRIFPAFPEREEIDIYALMDPAKEVGGDFYDFFFVTENKLFFLIADVTGKGVPASLFMAISKTLIKNEALRDVPPLEVLNNVNKIIIPDNDESMFVTVFCAILDVKTGELQYGIAGHNPPLLYRSSKDFQYLKPEKSFVLGVMDTAKFATAGFTLKPGDTLFLYSDGVTEAMNENDELFSEKRLQESLGSLKEKNAEAITLGIKKAVADFVQEAPPSDDLTILVLRFKG